MKHSMSMIKYLFMNYLPIFSRWLWKYVVNIRNISLLSQIIGSHFWWYLCNICFFQPTKYLLSATNRLRNLPTLLWIIWKSLFFFQQCMYFGSQEWSTFEKVLLKLTSTFTLLFPLEKCVIYTLSFYKKKP